MLNFTANFKGSLLEITMQLNANDCKKKEKVLRHIIYYLSLVLLSLNPNKYPLSFIHYRRCLFSPCGELYA